MAVRGQFSNRLGFIMAAAGSAVGLGNIWKFPFEVGQGGGAVFVVMYLIFCFLLCLPVMVTEIAIGRKTQRNPVGAFNALGYKKWNFVGKLGIISGILILSFYNVVAAWAFGYVFEMVMGNFDIGNHFTAYTSDIFKISIYAVVFMVATAYIVSQGVSKGIERATKIMMPTLIVIILFLVIYSLTKEGSLEGLKFYFQPDFSEINGKVIYGALGQAFFSLSLGMGALITYGSYFSKKDNITTSASIITLMDVGIALIAGLMMFPFVSFMVHNNPQLISSLIESKADVAAIVAANPGMSNLEIFLLPEAGNSGAGLIFATLPTAFESMGAFGNVLGAIFFLLLSFAALTSTVSLLEVPVAYVVDEKGYKRSRAVWLMAGIIFLIGIPSMLSGGYSAFFSDFITYYHAEKSTGFLSFISDTASDTFLPLGGFLITVFAAYVWKKENLQAELAIGAPGFEGSLVSKYISFAVTVLCPLILGLIFVLTVLGKFFGVEVFG
ncbi:sodium-dependent transporter [bacterium]|nr:sodium-dependent transporter [bacterium]